MLFAKIDSTRVQCIHSIYAHYSTCSSRRRSGCSADCIRCTGQRRVASRIWCLIWYTHSGARNAFKTDETRLQYAMRLLYSVLGVWCAPPAAAAAAAALHIKSNFVRRGAIRRGRRAPRPANTNSNRIRGGGQKERKIDGQRARDCQLEVDMYSARIDDIPDYCLENGLERNRTA